MHYWEMTDSQMGPRLQMWRSKIAEPLLADLAITKADQHDNFRNILLQNAGKEFLETTPDRYWGCGVNRAQAQGLSEEQLLARVNGQNRFGKILKFVTWSLSHPNLADPTPRFPILGWYVLWREIDPLEQLSYLISW